MDKKFAVIQLQGHQYQVHESQQLLVDHIDKPENHTFKINQVLLYSDGKRRHLGYPYLKNVSVKLKIAKHVKGPKIHVSTYKAKSRYRRHLGHRSQLTQVLVEKISPNKTS
jgi:large subunit ribosomal protein L21